MRTFSAASVAVDVADGHDRRPTKDAVDQDVEQIPVERDQLVNDYEHDCTGSGGQQEQQQASEDGHCLFIAPFLALHEAMVPRCGRTCLRHVRTLGKGPYLQGSCSLVRGMQLVRERVVSCRTRLAGLDP